MLLESLEDKVAIVTGSAQSIGAVIAEEFVNQNCNVMMADIDEELGKQKSEQLGDRAYFTHTDISNPGECENLVDETVEEFGGVDYLVNNAATYVDGAFEADYETWMESFAVNVVGGYLLTKFCRPYMKERGGGVVVNMSSNSAHRAQPGRMVYNATKGSIPQLTRSEALELADDGIRVVAVQPAWTWSRLMNSFADGNTEKYDNLCSEFHMLNRCGQPEEVARTILFLCSDASSFTTGTEVSVDGGYMGISGEGVEPRIDL